MEEALDTPSVAVIGSFRKYMKQIGDALKSFEEFGITVLSPINTEIIEQDVAFVRLRTDNSKHPDHLIQTITLHRILQADAVYVMVPDGYIGNTTCYEIGRVIQAGRPIYFSSQPVDLPIDVPLSHVISVDALAKKLLDERDDLGWPFARGENEYFERERELVKDQFKYR